MPAKRPLLTANTLIPTGERTHAGPIIRERERRRKEKKRTDAAKLEGDIDI